jgi:hypothetical protein
MCPEFEYFLKALESTAFKADEPIVGGFWDGFIHTCYFIVSSEFFQISVLGVHHHY